MPSFIFHIKGLETVKITEKYVFHLSVYLRIPHARITPRDVEFYLRLKKAFKINAKFEDVGLNED